MKIGKSPRSAIRTHYLPTTRHERNLNVDSSSKHNPMQLNLFASKKWLKLLAATAILGTTSLHANEDGIKAQAQPLSVHPQVFAIMQSWISDTENPVVTEINLDAAEKNRNQFPNDAIKEEGGWIVFRDAETKAFKRYRVVTAKQEKYKIEYQENHGGTLTISSVIEFSIVNRTINLNGKPTSIRVLRVDSHKSK